MDTETLLLGAHALGATVFFVLAGAALLAGQTIPAVLRAVIGLLVLGLGASLYWVRTRSR